MSATRNARRQMLGVVRSISAPKTIVVEVERTYKHPKYGKYMRRRKRYMAHDEEQKAQLGDLVQVTGTRPLSRRKRWRLLDVVKRAEFVETEAVAGSTDGGDL